VPLRLRDPYLMVNVRYIESGKVRATWDLLEAD
jgi:hypothetical protein